jgi:hypothetical protein
MFTVMIKHHVVLPSMFAVMIEFVVPCGVFEDYVRAELSSVLCVASCFFTLCWTCELASVLLLKFWTVPQAHLRIAGDPKFPFIYLEKKSFILNLFSGGRCGGGLKLRFWKCLFAGRF